MDCIAQLRVLDAKLTRHLSQASTNELVSEWFFSLPWPAWVKGLDGTLLAMNPAYTEAYDVSVHDYVGTVDGVWPEATRKLFGENDAEVLRTERAATYIERFHNPRTNRNENALVLKFPVYESGNLWGVGGVAVYIPT